ncbi:sugar nucleotide-binding protein [bacterium]|nr:sugar nucleotide-binding protein [bacterium]
MNSKLILVLGSTGMVGQALTVELNRQQRPNVGVARKNADICIDITHTEALVTVVEECRPDIIINCAAKINLTKCERNPLAAYLINTRPVGVLARLCTQKGIYLVQISTDHYYSGHGLRKHREDEPVALCNEYAISKYLAEHLALTAPHSLVLRTNVVGFRGWADQPTFVEWAISSLSNALPITLFSDYFTSSLDTSNFSRVLLDLMRLRAKGIINLASSEVSSKKHFVEALAQRLNLPLHNTRDGSVTEHDQIARNTSSGLDVSRAEALLGYRLPNRAEVIESLATQYSEVSSPVREIV